MELIEGESLQTGLDRQGPLPPAEAVALFRWLAGKGGLATAHGRGGVHRDSKPKQEKKSARFLHFRNAAVTLDRGRRALPSPAVERKTRKVNLAIARRAPQ